MKKIWKIAAAALALCAVSAGLFGCRNETEMTGQIDTVKSGIEKTRRLEAGEIMVYTTFKPEYETESLQNSVTESYTKFINGTTLEYDFTETEKIVSSGKVYSYEATCENGSTVVSRNGEKLDASEAPDIFAAFSIDYAVADVDKIEMIELGEQTLYTMTMNDGYAAKADHSEDGVEYDCTQVKFNYYVDAAGIVRTLLSEYTYTVAADENSQTVVIFSQAAVN